MLRIEAILGNNDVMAISEALRKIEIGGLTVFDYHVIIKWLANFVIII